MTIIKTQTDEIKITLTHTEVISCFGSYEKLYLMSDNVKTSLNILVFEIAKEKFKNLKDYEIKGKIIAQKNLGCKIILKLYKLTKPQKSSTVYYFKQSEQLIFAIKTIFSLVKNIKSDLYLMPDGYRLIVKDSTLKIIPEEFDIESSNSKIALAFTEEYGKPLILNDAICILQKTFIKDF